MQALFTFLLSEDKIESILIAIAQTNRSILSHFSLDQEELLKTGKQTASVDTPQETGKFLDQSTKNPHQIDCD